MVLAPLQQGPTPRGMELLVGFMIIGLAFAGLARLASNDGDLKHCGNCEQNVTTTKDFSWPVFLALLILGFGIGGILYTLYYTWAKNPQCPICGGEYLGPPQQSQQPNQSQGGQYQQGQQGSNQQNQNY